MAPERKDKDGDPADTSLKEDLSIDTTYYQRWASLIFIVSANRKSANLFWSPLNANPLIFQE